MKERIIFLEETVSTNDVAKELALQGAENGAVIIAKRQTGGKGRMGRRFESAEGGLYLSYILRPKCHARELMHLTCAAAVAACHAVEAVSGLRPGIKWTNDLVVDGKKVAGILTQLQLDADGNVPFAIIGIGINCLQRREDFPEELRNMAASLSMLAGTSVCVEETAAHLVRALDEMDLRSPAPLMADYRSKCITLGKEVSLLRGEEIRHGKALDIDDGGGLVVLFADGSRETVTSGEVSIRGMYGYV